MTKNVKKLFRKERKYFCTQVYAFLPYEPGKRSYEGVSEKVSEWVEGLVHTGIPMGMAAHSESKAMVR